MITKLITVEQMQFEKDGVNYDFDRYVFKRQTPMSNQDWNIIVNFRTKEITGDAVRYGTWDDLTTEECEECLSTLQPEQIKRDFKHLLGGFAK